MKQPRFRLTLFIELGKIDPQVAAGYLRKLAGVGVPESALYKTDDGFFVNYRTDLSREIVDPQEAMLAITDEIGYGMFPFRKIVELEELADKRRRWEWKARKWHKMLSKA